MKISEKLELISRRIGLTQTELARRFNVSFTTLNSWINNRSTPRAKKRAAIEELYLEVTGQKVIPEEILTRRKWEIRQKSLIYKNIVNEILRNPDIRDQFILKLTYHSNNIEGSTLTELDTAAILFDNIALPNKSLVEQLEAKNHQTALNYVFEYVEKGNEIDENFILKMHSILMNGIQPDAGAYRNHAVRIIGVNLPTANYASITKLIPNVIKLINNKKKDVIKTTAEVHSEIERIHPFSDGNGRIGRLLMQAMLLKNNFAPAIIHQKNKQLYYTYLYKAQTKKDYGQLENFLCDSIIDGFKILERKDI